MWRLLSWQLEFEEMMIIKEEEKFRYKLMLKLLFSMMFGWTSQRFQSLYEAGKIDNSLTLEVEVEELFHFVILTMDTQRTGVLISSI